MNAPWRLATAALQAAAQAKLQAAKASLLLAPLSFAVSAFLALLQAVPKTPGAPAAAKAIRARFFLKFFVGNSVEASKASAPKSAPAPKPQATHRGASRSIAERMRCVLGFGRSFFWEASPKQRPAAPSAAGLVVPKKPSAPSPSPAPNAPAAGVPAEAWGAKCRKLPAPSAFVPFSPFFEKAPAPKAEAVPKSAPAEGEVEERAGGGGGGRSPS